MLRLIIIVYWFEFYERRFNKCLKISAKLQQNDETQNNIVSFTLIFNFFYDFGRVLEIEGVRFPIQRYQEASEDEVNIGCISRKSKCEK